MFHKQEHSILALISGKNSLTNQRLDKLNKDKFKNMGDKIQELEEKINLMKEEIYVIQTTKPSWVIEADAKLIDSEVRSRQNNLRLKE